MYIITFDVDIKNTPDGGAMDLVKYWGGGASLLF